MIKEIIETFEEPFRSTALSCDIFSFDYKLNEGKNDHRYLKKHGYHCHMGDDCSYYVDGLKNLSPTSYGDWGTIFNLFDEEKTEGYNKSFCEFCKMYEEGIVKLWRMRTFINSITYYYNDEEKTWKKCENFEWRECDNPLISNKENKDLTVL